MRSPRLPWWLDGATWPNALIKRYRGTADRLVMYLAEDSILEDPANLNKWGVIARAVHRADSGEPRTAGTVGGRSH
jgi:hypothetical protein